jgi:hypothetical protein
MKLWLRSITAAFVAAVIFLPALPAAAQMIQRTDAIWARSAPGVEMTVDGRLDESAWAQAETHRIRYGHDNGMPGSGWRIEGGEAPSDPTDATVKFLVQGDYLFIGIDVKDKSVGGSNDWARWDAVFMQFKNRAAEGRPTPATEAIYGWWYPQAAGPLEPGLGPRHIGHGMWANWDIAEPRTAEQIENWTTATVVHGQSNDDAVEDEGYTMEMRFNLAALGYGVTRPEGDVIEWSIGIWDADFLWPINQERFSSNRTWWQNPWGNTAQYGVVRIHARPDVTVETAELPRIQPDLIIRNAGTRTAPTIDGNLDGIWSELSGFWIRYDDPQTRAGYPGVGPYLSGQWQPDLGRPQRAPVIDPAEAYVRMFFKDNRLFISADVNDQVVQSSPDFDLWDGFMFTINDRTELDPGDSRTLPRELSVRVGPDGTAVPGHYLATLVDDGKAEVALRLKPGTVVNNPSEADTGYTVEISIDLTGLGYPADRGDGVLFIGVTHFDGDVFDDPLTSYGTRTWFFREFGGSAAPAWAYMDPATLVSTDRDNAVVVESFTLLGNYPNPFNPSTTLRYVLPEAGQVTVRIFDMSGREVRSLVQGVQAMGEQEALIDASGLSSGVYVYHVTLQHAGGVTHSNAGRMVLIK